MVVFTSRHVGYKVSLVGLLLTALVYLVGFASPHWMTMETAFYIYHSRRRFRYTYRFDKGLWAICIDSCRSLDLDDVHRLYHAVRACESVGLLLLCGAVIAGLCLNCWSGCRLFYRTVEILSAVGGLIGFIGVIIYVVKYQNDSVLFVHFGWSLYLAAIGSGGAVIAAIVIAVFNKPLAETPGVGQSVAMSQVEGQQQGPGFQSPGMVHVVSPQAGPYSPPAQGPPTYPTAPHMSTTSMPPPQGGYYPSVYSSPNYGTKY